MQEVFDLNDARRLLREGALLAYPTEAVYGLGCDPFNQEAVQKLLDLKHRSSRMGLIVLIAEWSQLFSLTDNVSEVALQPVKKTWPGPVTWVFPKSDKIPEWISGDKKSVAIRMSAHPVAHALALEGPVVSTSANLSGQAAATTLETLRLQFPQGIDAVVMGSLGGLTQPSAIYDVQSGVRLR